MKENWIVDIKPKRNDIGTVIYKSKTDAWNRAKELAMNEAEYVSQMDDCEMEIMIDSPKNQITLNYPIDNSCVVYNVRRKGE